MTELLYRSTIEKHFMEGYPNWNLESAIIRLYDLFESVLCSEHDSTYNLLTFQRRSMLSGEFYEAIKGTFLLASTLLDKVLVLPVFHLERKPLEGKTYSIRELKEMARTADLILVIIELMAHTRIDKSIAEKKPDDVAFSILLCCPNILNLMHMIDLAFTETECFSDVLRSSGLHACCQRGRKPIPPLY